VLSALPGCMHASAIDRQCATILHYLCTRYPQSFSSAALRLAELGQNKNSLHDEPILDEARQ
jgi:hypothetical protein